MSLKTKLSVAFLVSLVLLGGIFFFLRNRQGPAEPAREADSLPARPEAPPLVDKETPGEAPLPPVPEKKAEEKPRAARKTAAPAGPAESVWGGWILAGRIVREAASSKDASPAAAEAPAAVEPVAGVSVHLKPHPRNTKPEDAPPPQKKVTGPDGRFEIAGIAGRIWLRLEIDEPSSALRTLSFSFSEPGPDNKRELGDLYLDQAGSLAVKLVGPKGEAVEKGTVLIKKQDRSNRSENFGNLGINESRREAVERGNGEYLLERVPVGPLYVQARAPGYAPSQQLSVDIPRDEPFVIALNEGFSIAGTVLTAEGKPIAKAELEASGSSDPQKTKSDDSGRFVFDALGAGDHSISAGAEGFASETRRNVPAGTEDLEFALNPEAVFAGKAVAEGTGAPVAKARVTLRAAQGNASFSAEADGEGAFKVRKIAAGTFTVTADHPEYATTAAEEPRELKAGEKVEGEIIRLKAGLSAAGKVVEAESQAPVPEAQVVFQLQGDAPGQGTLSRRTAKSGDKGAFEVKGLTEGNYRLSASAKGYFAGKSSTASIAAGGEREFTIVLELGCSISGRVTDPAGQPVAGATVRPNVSFSQFNNNWNELNERFGNIFNLTAQSDAEGRYRLEGLVPHSSYSVAASHRDYAAAKARGLALEPREALENVDLQLSRGGGIRGRVLDEKGKGIAGANVNAFPNRAAEEEREWVYFGEQGGSATSGEGGGYAINHLATGNYTVRAQVKDRVPASQNPVQVTEDGLADKVDLVLGLGESISGRVIDDSGAPIAGAEVRVYTETSVQGRTDGEGKFTLNGLPRGQVSVNVFRDGYDGKYEQVSAPAQDLSFTLKRAARLSGVVRAPGGESLGNFQIMAIGVGKEGRPSSSRSGYQGDPDGKFNISVGEGTYYLVAMVPGFAPSKSAQYTVKAGDRVDGIAIDLLQGGMVQGTVVALATQQPVGGASVSIQPTGPDQQFLAWGGMPTKTTNPDGSFLLEGVPEGTVTLVANHKDYAASTLPGVAVRIGSPATVKIDLRSGGGVYGIVTRAGQPVAGARLYLWPIGNLTLGGSGREGITSAEGKYEIKGLAAGEYSVSVMVPNQGNRGSYRNRENVTVFDGQMTELNLEEEPGVRLTGQITLGGTPVGSGHIAAIHHQSGGGGESGAIDASGRYSIELPGPGEYSLIVQVGNIRGRDAGVRVPVTIPPGQSDLAYDIELPSGEISGTVVDAETGEPISKVQLVAFSGGGGGRSMAALFMGMQSMSQTDGQGQFRISNLAPGTYTVRAFAEGYAEARLEGLQIRDGTVSSRNRIPLERGVTISARVVTADDQPVSQAMAILRDASGDLVAFARPAFSDPSGNLEIHGLRPGIYRLTVNHGSYAPSSIPVKVEAEPAQGPTVVLRHGGKAQIEVTGRNGRPVDGAEVKILDAKGENVVEDKLDMRRGPFQGTQTGKNGALTIDQLPPGAYRAIATKGNASSREAPLTIIEGQTAEVRLALDG